MTKNISVVRSSKDFLNGRNFQASLKAVSPVHNVSAINLQWKISKDEYRSCMYLTSSKLASTLDTYSLERKTNSYNSDSKAKNYVPVRVSIIHGNFIKLSFGNEESTSIPFNPSPCFIEDQLMFHRLINFVISTSKPLGDKALIMNGDEKFNIDYFLFSNPKQDPKEFVRIYVNNILDFFCGVDLANEILSPQPTWNRDRCSLSVPLFFGGEGTVLLDYGTVVMDTAPFTVAVSIPALENSVSKNLLLLN